ncbi:MAG: PAC2 family protein [Acidimicrobiales bacterium]|nr:PAC2 family protein [Acidimicrobiales bacterium]
MADLYERRSRPVLDRPVMIMALEGWIDAGLAASSTAATLLAELDTEPVASFDVDSLLDHRARRPILRLVAGVSEELSWPTIDLLAATDEEGHDLLLLVGPEPDHSWRAFGNAIVDLATEFDATMIVGLGAYPAAVPHTRPVRLSITAGTDALAARWGYLRGSLDVPAGAQAVIERFAADRGLDALTLWAQIPHYASGGSYAAGSIALLENLERVTGLALPRGDLAVDAADVGERLDDAIARNDEHRAMLRALEEDADDELGGPGHDGPIPSGDELAAELERFLRDQGGT